MKNSKTFLCFVVISVVLMSSFNTFGQDQKRIINSPKSTTTITNDLTVVEQKNTTLVEQEKPAIGIEKKSALDDKNLKALSKKMVVKEASFLDRIINYSRPDKRITLDRQIKKTTREGALLGKTKKEMVEEPSLLDRMINYFIPSKRTELDKGLKKGTREEVLIRKKASRPIKKIERLGTELVFTLVQQEDQDGKIKFMIDRPLKFEKYDTRVENMIQRPLSASTHSFTLSQDGKENIVYFTNKTMDFVDKYNVSEKRFDRNITPRSPKLNKLITVHVPVNNIDFSKTFGVKIKNLESNSEDFLKVPFYFMPGYFRTETGSRMSPETIQKRQNVDQKSIDFQKQPVKKQQAPSDQIRQPIQKRQAPSESRSINKRQSSMLDKFLSLFIGTAEAQILPSSICDQFEEVIPGHNDENDPLRIDLVFMGPNMSPETVKDLSMDYVDRLFTTVPFDGEKDRFNVWYVNGNYQPATVDPNQFVCQCGLYKDPNSETGMEEILDGKRDLWSCGLHDPRYIFFCNYDCQAMTVGFHSANVAMITDKYYASEDIKSIWQDICLHEIGHLMGLLDEYVYAGRENQLMAEIFAYPNCPPSQAIGDGWWSKYFDNLTYYPGCDSGLNFKFHQNKLMDEVLESAEYGEVNEVAICKKILGDTKAVVGDFCLSYLEDVDGYKPEKCDDGEDNDNDGLVDCEDADCFYKCKENYCNDGKDNDNDKKVDCLDEDCCITAICSGKAGPGGVTCGSNVELFCFDKIDNDSDGHVDCDDPDCAEKCIYFDNCSSETLCDKGGSLAYVNDITCFNGVSDEIQGLWSSDSAVDCMDVDCWIISHPYDYSTRPSRLPGDTGWAQDQCQGMYWEHRVLVKQEGDVRLNILPQGEWTVGEIACGSIENCDHIEVKLNPNPDQWFSTEIDPVFAGINCYSVRSDFENLREKVPETGEMKDTWQSSLPYSAICKDMIMYQTPQPEPEPGPEQTQELCTWNTLEWEKIFDKSLLPGEANFYISSIWGLDAEHLYVTGTNNLTSGLSDIDFGDGFLLLYDGSTWTTLVKQSPLDIKGVYGTSPDNLYVFGATTKENSSFSQAENQSADKIVGFIGKVVGNAIDIMDLNAEVPSKFYAFNPQFIAGIGNIMYFPVKGQKIPYYNGTYWDSIDLVGIAGIGSKDVVWFDSAFALDSSNVFFGVRPWGLVQGWEGEYHPWIFKYNGADIEAIDFPNQVTAMWGTSGNNLYIGTQLDNIYNGAIYKYSDNQVQPSKTGTARITSIWGSGPNDIYAAEVDYPLWHYNGSSWTKMTPNIGNSKTIWGSGPNDIFILNDAGEIYRSVCQQAPTAE